MENLTNAESNKVETRLDLEIMTRSYSNISFASEKRGADNFQYYSRMLSEDLVQLGEKSGNYREKFCQKVMNIFHKQTRCASSFIVGPANYDLKRHEKTWNSREKAESDFWHWREKYFKAVNRERTLSPEEEIDKSLKEVDDLGEQKETYKEVNKLLRKGNKDEAIELLKKYKKDKYFSEEIEKYNSIPSWAITSLTTKIRERGKKLKAMKSRIEAKSNFKEIFFQGGSINIENDRVVIKHDVKPSRETIEAISQKGFRWSPKANNWCRKHTAAARYAASELLKNIFGGPLEETTH